MKDEMRGVFVFSTTLPNGLTHRFDLDEVCSINLDDLQNEMANHSRRYAFYAMCQIIAKDAVVDYGREIKKAEANIDGEIRDQLGKTTETHIKQVKMSRLEDMHKKLGDLEKAERALGVVRESLVQRRDALVSLGMYRAPEAAGSVGDRIDRQTARLGEQAATADEPSPRRFKYRRKT